MKAYTASLAIMILACPWTAIATLPSDCQTNEDGICGTSMESGAGSYLQASSSSRGPTVMANWETMPDGYERVTEPIAKRQEEVGSITLVVTSYMIIWILVFGFIFFMWQRQRRISREISLLEEKISYKEREQSN